MSFVAKLLNKMIKTIAFDADDTLWHTERIFISVKEKYARQVGS